MSDLMDHPDLVTPIDSVGEAPQPTIAHVEPIVQAVYKAVLGRAADQSGLRHYTNSLQHAESDDQFGRRLEAMLREIIGSREYLLQSPVDRVLENCAPEASARTLIRHVASLGAHCATSMLLKHAGLKRYSLPFDWQPSSARLIKDIIADDFDTLLDRRQHGLKPEADGVLSWGHDVYSGAYDVPEVFGHYDMGDDGTYDYYRRCVERFRRLLDSGEPTLFLMIGYTDRIAWRDIERLKEVIDRRCSAAHLLVIAVDKRYYEDVGCGFESVGEGKQARLLRFRSLSGLGPMSFNNSFDALLVRQQLLRYRFDLAESI